MHNGVSGGSRDSVYTSALIKHSQHLRQRSVSPSTSRVSSVPIEKYKKCNGYNPSKIATSLDFNYVEPCLDLVQL